MILRIVLLLVASLSLGAAPPRREAPAPREALALTHVNIVDVVGGGILPDRTILIRGGRIFAVQPAARPIPAGYRRLDGHGEFAVPGLWDAHVHLSDASLDDAARILAPAFVAAGVTTVRDMGGNLGVVDTVRELVGHGAVQGPTILRAGPFIDGPKEGATDRVAVETAAQGAAAVRALKEEGVDFLKIHNGISRDAFFAVTSSASRAGLRVAVHLPHSISAEEAAEAGVATLEHTETLMESGLRSLSLKGRDADEGARALAYEMRSGPNSLIARMRQRGTCFTPTLSEYRSFAGAAAAFYPLTAPKVAPPSLIAFWNKYFQPEPPENAWKNQLRQTIFRSFLPLVKAFDEAGIPIVAGTDLGARDIFPGYSLHEELKLLSEAGLSNLHVLRSATINPARCMGVDDRTGSIAAGKAADVVLVSGNPLEDLAALGRIHLVVSGGRVVAAQPE